MSAPVVHFEIHATDRPALAKFYEDAFGWATQSAEGMPYTLVYPGGKVRTSRDEELDAPGIAGGMLDRMGDAPVPGAPVTGFVCVIQVDDLAASREAVVAHGGTITMEPFEVQGVGHVFYFLDPDNNVVGALQPADGA